MGRYTGVHCPVCDKAFTDDDAVVVCPVCGAPYHRECYDEKGTCIFPDLHKTNTAWAPAQEKYSEQHVPFQCPNCGTPNPAGGIFCQVCGTRLNGEASQKDFDEEKQDFFGNGPFPISPNPFTTPYGGVGADEEIDGIPAKDLVLFVGENSHYFLPKFKDMKQKTNRISFNWSALFFNSYYFLFRKMYAIGLVFLAISVLLSIPSLIFSFVYTVQSAAELYAQELPELAALAQNIPEQFLQQWSTISTVTRFLSFAFSLFMGFYANRLYMNHTFRKIRLIRQNNPEYNETEYATQLSKKGRTNRKLILILLASALILYFISSVVLFFTM